MDKKVPLVVSLLMLAVSVGSANFSLDTPLYTYRMEQASSKMHFLPTEQSTFKYTTEQGRIIESVIEYCTVNPVDIPPTNEQNPCEWTVETCPQTCVYTCPNTCDTCDTCWSTCETCYASCHIVTCGTMPCQ